LLDRPPLWIQDPLFGSDVNLDLQTPILGSI
jgi:hypothetical protein